MLSLVIVPVAVIITAFVLMFAPALLGVMFVGTHVFGPPIYVALITIYAGVGFIPLIVETYGALFLVMTTFFLPCGVVLYVFSQLYWPILLTPLLMSPILTLTLYMYMFTIIFIEYAALLTLIVVSVLASVDTAAFLLLGTALGIVYFGTTSYLYTSGTGKGVPPEVRTRKLQLLREYTDFTNMLILVPHLLAWYLTIPGRNTFAIAMVMGEIIFAVTQVGLRTANTFMFATVLRWLRVPLFRALAPYSGLTRAEIRAITSPGQKQAEEAEALLDGQGKSRTENDMLMTQAVVGIRRGSQPSVDRVGDMLADHLIEGFKLLIQFLWYIWLAWVSLPAYLVVAFRKRYERLLLKDGVLYGTKVRELYDALDPAAQREMDAQARAGGAMAVPPPKQKRPVWNVNRSDLALATANAWDRNRQRPCYRLLVSVGSIWEPPSATAGTLYAQRYAIATSLRGWVGRATADLKSGGTQGKLIFMGAGFTGGGLLAALVLGGPLIFVVLVVVLILVFIAVIGTLFVVCVLLGIALSLLAVALPVVVGSLFLTLAVALAILVWALLLALLIPIGTYITGGLLAFGLSYVGFDAGIIMSLTSWLVEDVEKPIIKMSLYLIFRAMGIRDGDVIVGVSRLVRMTFQTVFSMLLRLVTFDRANGAVELRQRNTREAKAAQGAYIRARMEAMCARRAALVGKVVLFTKLSSPETYKKLATNAAGEIPHAKEDAKALQAKIRGMVTATEEAAAKGLKHADDVRKKATEEFKRARKLLRTTAPTLGGKWAIIIGDVVERIVPVIVGILLTADRWTVVLTERLPAWVMSQYSDYLFAKQFVKTGDIKESLVMTTAAYGTEAAAATEALGAVVAEGSAAVTEFSRSLGLDPNNPTFEWEDENGVTQSVSLACDTVDADDVASIKGALATVDGVAGRMITEGPEAVAREKAGELKDAAKAKVEGEVEKVKAAAKAKVDGVVTDAKAKVDGALPALPATPAAPASAVGSWAGRAVYRGDGMGTLATSDRSRTTRRTNVWAAYTEP